MRYGQLVMGPAGSGKSTYCHNLAYHCRTIQRSVAIVNLDPAAEYFAYDVQGDIRDLIQLDDVMEDKELHFGPNGGLLFCMEFFQNNLEWLDDMLGDEDDDYIIFDCPGQIELYTHVPILRNICVHLETKLNFRICGVFLLDSQFMVDTAKFFSGILTSLSCMIQMELPHINVMSKIDLLSKSDKNKLDRFLEPDMRDLMTDYQGHKPGFRKLTLKLASLLDDYAMVRFFPLDIADEDTIQDILISVDAALQYDEDRDVKTKDMDDDDGDNGIS